MNKNFIEKINILFKLLDCTNTDIAHYMECNPSNVSRIRTGARIYSPTDKTLIRFAEGIFLYADDENLLLELCSLCGSNYTNRDSLIPIIIAWLYDSERIDISQIQFNHIKKKKQKNNEEIKSFGERLNNILNLLELSNTRLAKIINVDNSLISRFRSGLRSPKANPRIMALLAETLYLRADNQRKICELSKLCNVEENIFTNKEIGIKIVSDWLYNSDNERNVTEIEGLLNYIDDFTSDKRPKSILEDNFLTDNIMISNQKVYWGIKGFREAVLRFLSNAKESASNLWLYSDEDTKWLTEDKAFITKWYTLMLECVKKNIKIKIIHNIDRSIEEMVSLIQSWIPLYMSGKIESYVCKKSRNMRFCHTFFINPNNECISSSYVSTSEKMWYDYYCGDEKQKIIEEEFEKLLNLSEPLLKIYPDTELNPLAKKTYNNELSSLLTSLSLGTMPKILLINILNRSEISKEVYNKILTFAENQRERLFYALQNGKVTEFLYLPSDEELFTGHVSINISSSLCNTTLYYSVDEYSEHIKSMVNLLELNKNYIIYPIPQIPFEGIQLIRTEKSVTVVRSKPPYLTFEITEPLLCRAIDEYFQVFIEKYSTYRQDIKNKLLRYMYKNIY